MSNVKIKVINTSSNPLPTYETSNSAGMDLKADIEHINDKFFVNAYIVNDTLCIEPGGRALIPTGLHISLPEGYEAQIRPRSGMALKQGITVLNTPGTIDADYRGDVGIILFNTGLYQIQIKQGDRIAQMIINKYETAVWEEVESLENTERGEGGFGHTGK